MIGDWVLDRKKPAQITGIICDDFFETTLSPSVGGEYISPIPLTPEILEQNGFERVNGDYQDVFYVYDGVELLIDDVYTLFGQCKMQIMYVHELQHALKLCRIEKDIEI